MQSFKKFIAEADKYCSDKCCGTDVKAEDCPCPADCPHCDCNAVKNETFDPKHPKVVAARKAHKAGTYDGNMDKNGNAIVHIDGKPHTVTKGDPAAKYKNEEVTENYTHGSEKSMKGGHRALLKNPQGKTSYLGGTAYKKPKHAEGEAAFKRFNDGKKEFDLNTPEEFEKYIGCARFVTNLNSLFVTFAKYKHKSKVNPLLLMKMTIGLNYTTEERLPWM